jgi:hypothetical protein
MPKCKDGYITVSSYKRKCNTPKRKTTAKDRARTKKKAIAKRLSEGLDKPYYHTPRRKRAKKNSLKEFLRADNIPSFSQTIKPPTFSRAVLHQPLQKGARPSAPRRAPPSRPSIAKRQSEGLDKPYYHIPRRKRAKKNYLTEFPRADNIPSFSQTVKPPVFSRSVLHQPQQKGARPSAPRRAPPSRPSTAPRNPSLFERLKKMTKQPKKGKKKKKRRGQSSGIDQERRDLAYEKKFEGDMDNVYETWLKWFGASEQSTATENEFIIGIEDGILDVSKFYEKLPSTEYLLALAKDLLGPLGYDKDQQTDWSGGLYTEAKDKKRAREKEKKRIADLKAQKAQKDGF